MDLQECSHQFSLVLEKLWVVAEIDLVSCVMGTTLSDSRAGLHVQDGFLVPAH